MYYDFIYIKVKMGNSVFLWNVYLGIKFYFIDKVSKK